MVRSLVGLPLRVCDVALSSVCWVILQVIRLLSRLAAGLGVPPITDVVTLVNASSILFLLCLLGFNVNMGGEHWVVPCIDRDVNIMLQRSWVKGDVVGRTMLVRCDALAMQVLMYISRLSAFSVPLSWLVLGTEIIGPFVMATSVWTRLLALELGALTLLVRIVVGNLLSISGRLCICACRSLGICIL